MTPWGLEFIWVVVAIAGATALAGLGVVACVGRRSAHRHCPRCDHQQPPAGACEPTGSACSPCAECGFTPGRGFRRRHAPRRARGTALFLASAAFPVLIAYRSGSFEWKPMSLVPSGALAWVGQANPPTDWSRDACDELARRVAWSTPGAELIPAMDLAVDTVVQDPESPLGQVVLAWFQSIALREEDQRCVEASARWAASIRRALPRLRWLPAGPSPTIHAAEGSSPLLWMAVDSPWTLLGASGESQMGQCEVEVIVADEPARRYAWTPAAPGQSSIGIPLDSTGQLGDVIPVRLRLRSRSAPDAAWSEWAEESISAHVVRHAVEAVGTHTPELDAAILEALGPSLWYWGEGDRFGFRFDPRRTASPGQRPPHVGLRVEVREGPSIRRLSRMLWDGTGSEYEVPVEDIDALRRAVASTTGWTVRITGDRDLAFRDTLPPLPNGQRGSGASTASASAGGVPYWDGELTIPLSLGHLNAPAPPRRWQRLDDIDLRAIEPK